MSHTEAQRPRENRCGDVTVASRGEESGKSLCLWHLQALATLMRGQPPCDLCWNVSTRVICKGSTFLRGLKGEKRVLLSERQGCTSLILLIIKIDVFPNCWFSLEYEAQHAARQLSQDFPPDVPGMAQVRKKLSFFISILRAAYSWEFISAESVKRSWRTSFLLLNY